MSAPPSQPPPSTGPVGLQKVASDFEEKTGFFSMIQSLTVESAYLSPYYLTSGLLILSSITLNYPLLIMSLSMIEALLLRIPMEKLFTSLSPITEQTGESGQASCKSGYSHMTPPMFTHFLTAGLRESIPIPSLYILSTAFSYTISSMLQFTDEMEKLGTSYSNRPYLAILAGALFLLTLSIFLYSSGCNGFLSIGLTLFVGLTLGYLLQLQNFLLTGSDRAALNLLFMPTLTNAQPAYICAKMNP